jgi:hypothetical protein
MCRRLGENHFAKRERELNGRSKEEVREGIIKIE